NMVGREEWLAARDVTVDAAGNPICASEAARAAGCVPTDLYSTTMPGQQWLDYVMPYERYERTENNLLNVGLGINGELFEVPAGTVRFAAGAECREETLDTRDDPDAA